MFSTTHISYLTSQPIKLLTTVFSLILAQQKPQAGPHKHDSTWPEKNASCQKGKSWLLCGNRWPFVGVVNVSMVTASSTNQTLCYTLGLWVV